jgi:hypothetical protein
MVEGGFRVVVDNMGMFHVYAAQANQVMHILDRWYVCRYDFCFVCCIK